MKCPNCGADVHEDICPYCQTRVKKASEPRNETESARPVTFRGIIAEEIRAEREQERWKREHPEEARRQEKNDMKALIGAGIVALIMAGISIIFILIGRGTP